MVTTTTRLANAADLTFAVCDAADELRVTAVTGREGLSELYRFRVELCADNAEIDLSAMPGRKCSLALIAAEGTRYVSGIVQRFERTGCGSRLTHYAAQVVPVQWLLTRRHKSRIFQPHNCADMSVPGILARVFQDAGIPGDAYRLALAAAYEQREYVVQYRESDLDFIARLMEHEGIFYFFEHSADGHVMVISDTPAVHAPAAFDAELGFRTPDGLVPEQAQVHELREAEQIQFGAVSLDDFNFKQPASQLRSGLQADRFTALEFSDHPGEYDERGVGQRYAQVRMEEFQARRQRCLMRTTARGLTPGCRITLSDHPAAAANREYLVTRVVHRARQTQSAHEESGDNGSLRGARYEAEICAIPADVPFRPRRRTRRPMIHGTQTALVVGPAGEEIHTDEYGRVKVQFHWDQEGVYDENSSRWIRVSQGWAGGGYGMFFLPRVGQEVLVSFVEGNPDQPLIVGSVHNNDQMPPYKLPDEKTRSTIKTRSSAGGGGCNEIRFEDRKDAEQLFLFAQKDLHARSGNDHVQNVGRDQHLTVEQHRFELVKQNSHREVVLDLKEKIGGNRHLEVAGDVAEDFAGNQSRSLGGKYYLDAAGNIVLESASGICLKVGGNFITINADGIYVMGTVVHVNSAGSALSGSAVALKSPETPLEADTTDPGRDTTYAADPCAYEAVENEGDFASGECEEDETPTSWIEIELLDEAGRPRPSEPYEIVEPDGTTVRKGALDENGWARVAVSDPGACQISFPRLDGRAWSRTGESDGTEGTDKARSYIPAPASGAPDELGV